MKKASDIEATILNAIITNTKTKIIFGGLDPNDAEYMARVLFLGFIDYAEYKPGTERPVAVGNDKVIVRGRSDGEQYAEHDMTAHTTMRGRAQAHGTVIMEGSGSGVATSAGENAGQVLSPPMMLLGPNAGASSPQMILSENSGTSSSRSEFEQTNRVQGTSDVTIDSEGEADTVAHGRSRGRSHTDSENDAYITRYQWLPSQLYSSAEQLERLVGELINLGFRECFVKVANNRPVRTRTADVNPAFKSDYCKRIMMPLFLKSTIARSPYLLPAAQVDSAIAARRISLHPPQKPEHDFTQPDPALPPSVFEPAKYADHFWQQRQPASKPPSKPNPKKPRPGRRPVGDLPPDADRFTVVDGDGDKK